MIRCFVAPGSVVTVAGICNSVVGSVFLTCHRGGSADGGGEYRFVSRPELLIGNRWMSRLQDRSGCPGMC